MPRLTCVPQAGTVRAQRPGSIHGAWASWLRAGLAFLALVMIMPAVVGAAGRDSRVAAPTRAGLGPIDWSLVDQVWAEICAARIREPRTVMVQAIFETGWMRAPFLMSRNNLFGFRMVEYMRFDTWQQSVKYYKNWQDRNLRPEDTDYHAFLQRIRYGAPGYIQHLRKVTWNRDCPASQEPERTGGEAPDAPGGPAPVETSTPQPAQRPEAPTP